MNKAIGTPFETKLGKLIRLLGSDKPGEVVAAANAINRSLQSAGLDIHQLADAIESVWNADLATGVLAASAVTTKTPNRISEKPPRDGLSNSERQDQNAVLFHRWLLKIHAPFWPELLFYFWRTINFAGFSHAIF